MQESFSEITLAELPLVVFNMARGQQDYYQATRGGGHGDYRHIVLAPQDVTEGVELVQLAFHLADKWRNPALVYGDYLLAHTQEAITIEPIDVPRAARRRTGPSTARSRAAARAASVTPLGVGKVGQPAMGQEGKAQYIATKLPLMEREVRVETGFLDDAETVIVAFGSPAKFVKYAIRQLRDGRSRIGYVRPITLWPFPYATRRRRGRRVRTCGASAASSCRAGQMVDDVRIGVAGRAPVDVHRRRLDRPLRLRRRPHPRRRGRSPSGSSRCTKTASCRSSPATSQQLRTAAPSSGGHQMTTTIIRSARDRHLDRAAGGARQVEAQKPDLLLTQEHHMCPGCGEPLAVRQFLETIDAARRGRRARSRSPASVATRRSRARWTSISCRRCTVARRRSRPA